MAGCSASAIAPVPSSSASTARTAKRQTLTIIEGNHAHSFAAELTTTERTATNFVATSGGTRYIFGAMAKIQVQVTVNRVSPGVERTVEQQVCGGCKPGNESGDVNSASNAGGYINTDFTDPTGGTVTITINGSTGGFFSGSWDPGIGPGGTAEWSVDDAGFGFGPNEHGTVTLSQGGVTIGTGKF